MHQRTRKGFEQKFGPDHALALRTVMNLSIPMRPGESGEGDRSAQQSTTSNGTNTQSW
jgi:hypothetical protein